MSYLLDSDVLSSYLDREPVAVAQVESLMLARVAISIVTYMETFQLTFQGANPEERQRRHELALVNVPVLDFSLPVARRCARLRHDLSTTGRRVRARALDLIIAATAIEHDLTLVTRNLADYQDVPGLTLWN